MLQGREPRMRMVAVVFAVVFALLLARAVDLTVMRGPELARVASRQHRTKIALTPRRGEIVDRAGEKLALSVDVPSIFVRPRDFVGQEAQVPALAQALGMPVKTIRARVARRQPFVWLKRLAVPRQAEAVEQLGLKGVGTAYEGRRFYPYGALAAHVLGFVGVDSQGLGGVERRFDRVIQGEREYLEADRDAHGRSILAGGVAAGRPEGNRLELTLDLGIQTIAERELAQGVADARAAGGAAVVLDPWTGEVLALANAPTFNPNAAGDLVGDKARDRVRNRALTDPYEPGSTFKALLAAAALEEKVTSPSEMVFCENGRFPVGRWTIHDSHPHGWLSFAQVIQYSSNIGATKIGERLGRERWYAYLRRFGFGARTGVELPGETAGILRPVEGWARIDLATHSFGQGVSVTPLQMVAAVGAIANGGVLMKPFVVRRAVSPSGTVLFEHEPSTLRRVVSPETAHVTTDLLRRVVEEEGGTGAKARLDDFPVAGKTGTAQKVDSHGGYSSKRIGSFVGFVPADRPRLVILVLIDEPSTSSYGGIVAAPVFRRIALGALHELGVQPAAPPTSQVLPVATPISAAPEPPPEPVLALGVTPSFLGLSLREARARAQAQGWDVRTTGSGYVTGQQPPPGAPRPDDIRLALTLEPERASARP
ncbi:MAG: penicillin-binding transpeptidase domain-containing protein [Candidatus Binatia bacterium]